METVFRLSEEPLGRHRDRCAGDTTSGIRATSREGSRCVGALVESTVFISEVLEFH